MAVYKPRLEPVYKGDFYKNFIGEEDFKGVSFKDITTLLDNPLVFKEVIDHMCDIIQYYYFDNNLKIDGLVALEARGFIIGGAISYKMGIPLILARKPGKLPGKTISIEYELEYGKDIIEINEREIQPGYNYIIIDDLIATGGTTKAIIDLIRKVDFTTIMGVITIMNLKYCGGEKRIKESHVSLYSLIDYE